MRARYRYSEVWNMVGIGALMTVAMPFIAWKLTADGQPWAFLFPVVGIPVAWWYLLVHFKYRMDLTDTHLRLRPFLGPAVSVPLADLAEIGAPAGKNVVRVARRDGRSWRVYAGAGLVEFADEVGRVAPHVEVRTGAAQRSMTGLYRFFGDRGQ